MPGPSRVQGVYFSGDSPRKSCAYCMEDLRGDSVTCPITQLGLEPRSLFPTGHSRPWGSIHFCVEPAWMCVLIAG